MSSIYGNDLLRRSNRSASPNIKTINVDNSLFFEALDMLEENDKMINNYLVESRIEISESKSSIILEKFSIKELVRNIFDLFIDSINSIFAAFKNAVLKITATDKTIDKYEDKIRSITTPFETSFGRYIYTCFDPLIPNVNLKSEFEDIYDSLLEKFKPLANSKSFNERIARMQSIEADLINENTDKYFDSLRARMLNKKHGELISEKSFADEAFKTLRDGGELIMSKVTPVELSTILDRRKNTKNLIKETENQQALLIQDAKKVEKELNGITLHKVCPKFNASDTSQKAMDEEAEFKRIMNIELKKLNEICKMFILVYGAKLDALKESEIQDREVLVEAAQYYNSVEYMK